LDSGPFPADDHHPSRTTRRAELAGVTVRFQRLAPPSLVMHARYVVTMLGYL
jgi:hypothetical protein